jgi:release factor glutamine methyltransferase
MGRAAAGSTSAGSVADALGSATDALAAAGVAEPRFDAEVLLAEATGWERARIAADPAAGVPPAAAREFGAMIRRRIRREPVAYIVGRKGFRRIELEVDPRVLVPRPETEHLVEATLELSPSRVLEIGTGSGAVALALADELPTVEVWAADTSPAALAVARANAERLGLAGRVRFVAGTVAGEEFDVTVANLPYVSELEWGTLEPEVRDWEPREALLGGPDGLDAFREVIPLVSSPAVVLEVGAGQAEAVAELVRSAGYERIETRHDLAGIERVVLGRR